MLATTEGAGDMDASNAMMGPQALQRRRRVITKDTTNNVNVTEKPPPQLAGGSGTSSSNLDLSNTSGAKDPVSVFKTVLMFVFSECSSRIQSQKLDGMPRLLL